MWAGNDVGTVDRCEWTETGNADSESSTSWRVGGIRT